MKVKGEGAVNIILVIFEKSRKEDFYTTANRRAFARIKLALASDSED